MTKYADLAKTVINSEYQPFREADRQIFQTSKGGVSIITDEHEQVYYIDVSSVSTFSFIMD